MPFRGTKASAAERSGADCRWQEHLLCPRPRSRGSSVSARGVSCEPLFGGYWLGRSNGPAQHYIATTGAVRSHVQNSSETPGKPWFGVITSAMEGWGAGAPNPPVPASGPGILQCVGAAASAELPPAGQWTWWESNPLRWG